MIIKLKKRNLIIVSILFFILLIPLIYAAGNIVVFTGFGVELWIGNIAPVMKWDNTTSSTLLSTDPNGGTTVLVWFIFNVTDDNGEDDINEATTRFNLTLGAPGNSQWRYNNSCTNISKIPGENKVIFNCSIYLWYFDNASSNWVINATAFDDSSASAINDTQRFTYNELSSMTLPRAWINFTSLTLSTNNLPSGGALLVLNNTGNDDFEQVNVTASALIGQSNSETIAVGQFAVNYTNAVDGQGLPLSGATQVIPALDSANLGLRHGHTKASADYNDNAISDKGNQSLYFWVDVPGALTAQKFNNTWNITVIDLP